MDDLEYITSVYDQDLYKQVMNKDLCKEQISYMIMNNTYLISRFMDASARVPRGIFKTNFVDLGNYYQCLDIKEPYKESNIEGKYCVVQVPFYQTLFFSYYADELMSSDIKTLKIGPVSKWILEKFKNYVEEYQKFIASNAISPAIPQPINAFYVAVCIPRVCTVKWAVNKFLYKTRPMEYYTKYCRLPDDKPRGTADYVAVISFSTIIFLTLLSTIYELIYVFALKRGKKSANIYWRSLSLYNNTRLLLHFPQDLDTLKCLHGIKVISLLNVMCMSALLSSTAKENPFIEYTWIQSIKSSVLTIALIYVDTFFVITGILLVYLTADKFDGISLLKNLHVFYLRRLLRMLPLLATAIIFDASIFHKIADGPNWTKVARNAQSCRNSWWPTLLHFQNYFNLHEMCIAPSWYIAVDIQLHILSPVLLFWLLNDRRKYALAAIVAALVSTLSVSAFYNYSRQLPSSYLETRRIEEQSLFLSKYYCHIMSRITPFLFGMIIGYVLHVWRRKIITISKVLVLFLWLMTFGIIILTVYTRWLIVQDSWINEAVDNLINTIMRPAWAAAIGWMVVACVHGYGGPINWILSLDMWRLPARLAYGMYLFHVPIIQVGNFSSVHLKYFSVANEMYRYTATLVITFIVSFILTVLVEMPFKIWFKSLLDKCSVEPIQRRRLERYDVYELAESKDYY